MLQYNLLKSTHALTFVKKKLIMDVYSQILFCLMGCFTGVFGVEPSFDVPVINVTVRQGDVAILPCSVDYLGEHKVVWTDQWSTLLTLDDRRIIDDHRISIERPYMRDWNLHIRKTAYSDRGKYTCQINTNPVKTKTVVLYVLVPSQIVNEMSSQDQTVREGETVTLVCNVTGEPTPEVTWHKLPNDGMSAKERIGTAGEVLIIHNVSRYCDGTYECVAYNNVDPAVTRQIKVFVEFAPEVSLPNKRIGQYPGRETILDCEINAYPHGITRWQKDGRYIGQDSEKYQVELYSGSGDGTLKTLSLRVRNVQADDFGQYTCYAENLIGTDSEAMLLYDYSLYSQQKSTTSRPLLVEPTPKIISNLPIGNDKTNSGSGSWPWSDPDVIMTGRPGRKPDGTGSSNNLQRPHSYGGYDDTNKAFIPGNDATAYESGIVETRSGSGTPDCLGTMLTVCEGSAALGSSSAASGTFHLSLVSIYTLIGLMSSFTINVWSL